MSFGSHWENTFSAMWNDPAHKTVDEIARTFNISKGSAYKYAKCLLLPPRRLASWKHMNEMPAFSTNDQFHDKRIKKIEEYRMTWLSMRERYPTASRSELHAMMRKEVVYLRNHDNNWLEQHSPKPLPHKEADATKWESLDAELATRLRNARDKLLKGRKRVSRHALLKEIGAGDMLTRTHKIPETVRMAGELAESPTAAALRRIKQTVAEYEKRGLRISKANLIAKAGVAHYYYQTEVSAVKDAIECATEHLE
jgi:hypothetical protein